MAATSSLLSISLITTPAFLGGDRQRQQFLVLRDPNHKKKPTASPFQIRASAAKLPPGVELPKVEPKFEAPFLGFTTIAEVWNSRACMIGLIGTFIVELILNKGILQVIGVEVGKGLNLPL
ncbi:hypothetical protein MLD38_032628 [Melastoma candidum]|uniref:Uncharacterized protein n=1 Tax=Melastoma candidum TaxID=119954 RepID=A0ACB9M7W5_9MYRT|nr:hypothetical protein MLD38_032628 [Melastoma candidum]